MLPNHRAYSLMAGCGDRDDFIARPYGLRIYGIPASLSFALRFEPRRIHQILLSGRVFTLLLFLLCLILSKLNFCIE